MPAGPSTYDRACEERDDRGASDGNAGCARAARRRRAAGRREVVSGSTLPEPFEAQDVLRDGRRTLILSGDLDIASASALKEMLLDISRDGTTAITLDLRGLTFMDSTGLFMILFAKELADTNGFDLSLIPGSPKIQRIFELTALLDLLPFEAGEATAGQDYRATELG
ncbi:MAG: anti-sigma factor antagonist [Solirubrobacteraceae bacterium]|nr:anti-sigma factor antagonist [Solirubrobacteraceae bacterium]